MAHFTLPLYIMFCLLAGIHSENTSTHSCFTRMEERPFSMRWSIENFSSFLGDTRHKELQSTPFLVEGCDSGEWKLQLYPQGDSKGQPDHMSVFAVYTKPQYLTSYKITLKSKFKKDYSMFGENLSKVSSWGWSKYIGIDHLKSRREDLYPNNILEIIFEGKIGGDVVTAKVDTEHIEVSPSHLTSDFKTMLNSKVDADVSLATSDGGAVMAHRNILSARSSVFASMFRHDTLEKRTRVIKIQNVHPAVISEMIHYIYTDEEPTHMAEFAQDLLAVANTYDLPRLREMCERHLASTLNLDNVVSLLSFSHKNNAHQLRSACVRFASTRVEQLSTHAAWTEVKILPTEVLVDIVVEVNSNVPKK